MLETIFTKILIAYGLSLRMQDAWPTVDSQRAFAHASAAVAAAGTDLDPDLLIAIAHKESELNGWPVSTVRGAMFCGPMQAQAGASKPRCAELGALVEGYRAGADEVRYWLKRTRGNLGRSLNGHACGNAGADGSPCRGYAGNVLRRHRLLRGSGSRS